MLNILSVKIQKTGIMLLLLAAVMAVTTGGSLQAAGNAPQLTSIEQYALHHAHKALENKQLPGARKYLFDALSQQKGTAHYLVYFVLGNSFAMAEENDEAMKYYRKAAGVYDRDESLWQNMGKVSFDMGHYRQAGEYLGKAYDNMNPKDPELLFQAAGCFIMIKSPDRAVKYLELLCNGPKQQVKTVWIESLITVYLNLGRNQDAIRMTQRLLEKEPESSKWWKLLAQVHIKAGDYQQGAAAYEIYTRMVGPNKADTLYLGDLYHMAGVPLKAARQYERALEWVHTEKHYKKIVGAYLAAHEPDPAIRVLQRAVKDRPLSSLWYLLGTIQYNGHQYKKAGLAFRKCCRIDPQNARGWLLMGYCALQCHDPDDAALAFNNAGRFKKEHKAADRGLEMAMNLKRNPISKGASE